MNFYIMLIRNCPQQYNLYTNKITKPSFNNIYDLEYYLLTVPQF